MKFLIIFIFLAAAASLGLARKPEYGSHQSVSVSLPSVLSQAVPTPSGTVPTPSGTVPTPLESAPAESATTGQPSPTGVPDFASVVNKTANDPISELLSLSPQCQAALFTIVANPEFFTCVPVGALFPLLPLLADPNAIGELLKDPVHNIPPVLTPVLDGLCAAPKCSDDGVAGALKAVKAGCKSDAKSPLIGLITGVITFYSPLRDSVCFETNKKEFCVIDTLKKVFSLPKPPITITGTIIDNLAFAEPKFICTPCNKAILNTIFNYIDADTNQSAEYLASLGVPQGLISIAKLGVAVKCGFEFLDGDVGKPEKTDPDDFEYQLSNTSPSSASNLKGISFMTIGALLASTLMI